METIVSMEWVRQRLGNADVVIVDCRFALGKPDAGREAYAAGHLPGAVYIDLERDMSGPVTEHGGRHPLPDLGTFTLKLWKAGVADTSTVIAYDDQGGAMASRFWWMMHFLGHDQTVVMDGGFTKWQEAGLPVTDAVPQPAQRSFKPHVRNRLLVSMNEVKERLGRPGTVLIDSREAPRYRGEAEPIDRVAGHIPGAVNAFWKDSLGADGLWQPAAAQRERFAPLVDGADEVIVYCGSGVTACPNVLALKMAGYDNVKLYGGSWSDWISYADNPIATGEEGKA